jgi:hypothetical protein
MNVANAILYNPSLLLQAMVLSNFALDAGVGSSVSTLPSLPATVSVIRVLQAWVESSRRSPTDAAAQQLQLNRPAAPAAAQGVARLAAAAAAEEAATHSGTMGAAGSAAPAVTTEAAYWDGVAHTISARTVRVWKALDSGLHKYRSVLVRRRCVCICVRVCVWGAHPLFRLSHPFEIPPPTPPPRPWPILTSLSSGLMSDVQGLESSNAQLRQLVAQYMADPANSELHVPPAATIRVDPGAMAVLSSAAVSSFPSRGGNRLGGNATASNIVRRSTPGGRAGTGGLTNAAPLNSSVSFSTTLGPMQSASSMPILSVTSSPMPMQHYRS